MLALALTGCSFRRPPPVDPLPVVFSEESTPPIEQIIAAVNRTDAIEKMQSTSTTIELVDTGYPRLSASLAVARPHGLSIKGGIGLLPGTGFDLGSNDQVFWMRYPEGVYKTLVYASHDEYESNLLSGPLPVNPKWLIEAMGLVHLDPQLVIETPIRRADGHWEIRTQIPTASGTFRRILVVDGNGGFVLQQAIYDPFGRLVASAQGADFRYYDQEDVVLPHSVNIRILSTSAPPLSMQIEIGGYVLNQLLGEEAALFQLPAEGNHQMIDLNRMPESLPPAHSAPAGTTDNAPSLGNIPSLGNALPADTPPLPAPITHYVPATAQGPQLRGTTSEPMLQR